jgi:hypothetical protein
MEYLLLIYETAKDFDARTNEQRDTLMGAWRADRIRRRAGRGAWTCSGLGAPRCD